MRYLDFKESIRRELLAHPSGLTWLQLRDRLSLPYDHPCQTWVAQLEKEIGLERNERIHGAYVWKINTSKE